MNESIKQKINFFIKTCAIINKIKVNIKLWKNKFK